MKTMPAMPSVRSSFLVLLLVLVLLFSSSHAAVLAKAGCNNNDVSCFATPGATFRTRTCHQTPTMGASPSRWHQMISPGPLGSPPALEYGSKSFASKRFNGDDRDGMDGSGVGDLQESSQSSKKMFGLRFRQRLRKVAKVTSLALIHLTVLRLRPGSAVASAPGTVHDAAAPAPPVSPARRASVVRMMDDDRRVVQCSIKPGAIQAEDGTWTDPEREETGTLLEDFGGTATSDDAADTSPSPKKLSRKERRALRRQQRQKDKQWKEYGDDEEDDEEDFASGDGNLLSDGVGAAAAAAPGMGGPPGTRQGGNRYMTRPPGATGMSEKAKSNIQAKVILIAGGGYALTCFGYEGWQWNKEQKKVETSIEILGEQAKELGLKLESNATATDEEIADELRNITDTSEEDDEGGEENGDGGDSDDNDDDDDEPEPPRRRPRKPIRPTPDDDDDDDYGGGRGGAGDGRPSADDLDRLNKMFKKS